MPGEDPTAHTPLSDMDMETRARMAYPARLLRVLSSAGRASPLQGEGRGFDSLSTHDAAHRRIVRERMEW